MDWSNKAIAPAAAGLFSPQREASGLNARLLTPLPVRKIVVSGAETRSFTGAVIMMDQVGGQSVPRNTIQRVAGGCDLLEILTNDHDFQQGKFEVLMTEQRYPSGSCGRPPSCDPCSP